MAIAQSIPAPAWLLTHSPFNAVRRDKTTGENKVDNTIQQEAVGDILSPGIAMVISGHIHIFEALTFGQTNPERRPQLVVGTGGDKLAKKPEKPIVVDGVTVDGALILKASVTWSGIEMRRTGRGNCSMKTARQSRTAG